ncbi:MAG: LytTR family transcriptional regulator, partial [Bacteroidales bacterium]|nr:LytTR family transcriptional regulator [Bacteroidales bacterium]
MNQKIPDYLYEKGNIVRLIFFTAFFALAFINLYKPFGSNEWFRVSEAAYFLGSSMIMLTGVIVVVISRIIMYQYCKKKVLTLLGYLIWVLAEILAMSTFYTIFEKSVLHDVRPIEEMIQQSFINTCLVLLLPYGMSWLYFSWKDKNKKLQQIAMEENTADQNKKGMLSFFDEKGD